MRSFSKTCKGYWIDNQDTFFAYTIDSPATKWECYGLFIYFG